jgi:hypothetical protein
MKRPNVLVMIEAVVQVRMMKTKELLLSSNIHKMRRKMRRK